MAVVVHFAVPLAFLLVSLGCGLSMARELQFLQGSYSQVFLTADSRYAFGIGYSDQHHVAGIHAYKQAGAGSWCYLNSIPLPELARSRSPSMPVERLVKLASIGNTTVVSLDSVGYALRIKPLHHPELFEIASGVSSTFSSLLSDQAQGWRVYDDTLVILRWDSSIGWGSMKLDYYTLDPSTLDFVLQLSEDAPENRRGSQGVALWTDDRFVVRTNSPGLFFAHAVDQAAIQVLVTRHQGKVGYNQVAVSSIEAPAKWIQMTHLAHNGATGDAAINTMNDSVVLFRASHDYSASSTTTLQLGIEGRYAAQLAFEGELLAVSFEPSCSNHTYLLLYRVNATSAQPLGFKQVHYTNGDWSRQGNVFYLTESWLALRGSPLSTAYLLYPISAAAADSLWESHGFTMSSDFGELDACADTAMAGSRVLCAGLSNIVYRSRYNRSSSRVYDVWAMQLDAGANGWNQSVIGSVSFSSAPTSCQASNSTVVFQLRSQVLQLCTADLGRCDESAEAAVAYALNTDVLVYSYKEPTAFPAIALKAMSFNNRSDTLAIPSYGMNVKSCGLGDELVLCNAGNRLLAITIANNASSASPQATLVGQSLYTDQSGMHWDMHQSTVSTVFEPMYVSTSMLACWPSASATAVAYARYSVGSALLEAAFTSGAPSARIQELAAGQAASGSWHQQLALQGDLLVTTLRQPDAASDLVVVINTTTWKILCYARCDNCHRPRAGEAAFTLSRLHILLAKGDVLRLPTCSSSTCIPPGWTSSQTGEWPHANSAGKADHRSASPVSACSDTTQSHRISSTAPAKPGRTSSTASEPRHTTWLYLFLLAHTITNNSFDISISCKSVSAQDKHRVARAMAPSLKLNLLFDVRSSDKF